MADVTKSSCGGDTEAMLRRGMEEIEGINEVLHKGIPVHKITSRGLWVSRVLTLCPTKMVLYVTHHILRNAADVKPAKMWTPLWSPGKGWNKYKSYTRFIDVADLDHVVVGCVATKVMEKANPQPAPQQVVSIYHHGYQSVDVVIDNESHREALVYALRSTLSVYKQVQQVLANDALLLRYIWFDVDVDKSGSISPKEFHTICKIINLQIDEKDDAQRNFKNYLQEQGIQNRQELNWSEVRKLLRSIKDKMGLNDLWGSLFGKETKSISAETLLTKFLHGVQGETDKTLEDAKSFIAGLESVYVKRDSTELDRDQFEVYLHSSINDAYDPKTQASVGGLTQPISKYWINTSHNTYLTGDQLKSRSSVEAYVLSMLRGCKCLELDCWDGDTVPIVFHGHTLTSKITFRSICLVVQNYLEANPNANPIILSLENHCSLDFQRIMARDMREIFKTKLFIPNKEKRKNSTSLPSPEELRGMVVIKGKRPPESDDYPDDDELGGKEEDDPYDIVGTPQTKDKKHDDSSNVKPLKINPELAKMTLFHGTKYKSFAQSVQESPSHMHSISEPKITKLATKDPSGWRQYNIDHMTRTYPAGARVNSSNYNPMLAWSMGCQLVALNFQTPDTPLLLNVGRFHQGNNGGYILKPSTVMGIEASSPKNIKLSVVSGHCLPKPHGDQKGERIDPYVKVEWHDVKRSAKGEEHTVLSHRTAAIQNNGFCPVWNDPPKLFTIETPNVAMLLLKVIDQDSLSQDDSIAFAAIPFNCLRKGYRSVQLYDNRSNLRTGPFQYSTLLVKIDFDWPKQAEA